MTVDRTHVRLDEPYVSAVGRALLCFARCEWAAAYCCHTLQPGYLNTIEDPKNNTTAGMIAEKLIGLINSSQLDATLKMICKAQAVTFKRLAKQRNDLVHARLGTVQNEEQDQRLFRYGEEWTIEKVNELSDQSVRCELVLGDMRHNHLIELKSGKPSG